MNSLLDSLLDYIVPGPVGYEFKNGVLRKAFSRKSSRKSIHLYYIFDFPLSIIKPCTSITFKETREGNFRAFKEKHAGRYAKQVPIKTSDMPAIRALLDEADKGNLPEMTDVIRSGMCDIVRMLEQGIRLDVN